MTPFEGTSTCIETARPLQLLEVLSSACALVFLSSRSLTSLQTSGGPLTSSRITPDSLLPFVHPPPLSSCLLHANLARSSPVLQMIFAERSVTEDERWILSLPLVGEVKLPSLTQQDDLREVILATASGKLDQMKSLSGSGHHGGMIRVSHSTLKDGSRQPAK